MEDAPHGLCSPASPSYSPSGRSIASRISVSPSTEQHQEYLMVPVPSDKLMAVYQLLCAPSDDPLLGIPPVDIASPTFDE